MAVGLLGRKVGMTQVFVEGGAAVPVTVIEAGPCHVLQLRTAERDGYEAVQLGFVDKDRKRASRAERGHVAAVDSKRSKRLASGGVQFAKRAECEPKRFIRELRTAVAGYEVGGIVTVDCLASIAAVDVTGVTKGHGFSGVMKRHGFSGQRATHGVKKVHRHPGSTGCNTHPARVFKGRRMAGRWGSDQVTMRNLKVVRVDAEKNLLLVRGAIPGKPGDFVVIKATNVVHGPAKTETTKKK
jgi:large subunit ribosomal protein L3